MTAPTTPTAPTPDPTADGTTPAPSLWRWITALAASAGLAGVLCCVAPAVLFAFGLMGGVYAISFANFFYQEDGTAGVGAWGLRAGAVVIGLVGVTLYRRKQNACSIDKKRKRLNLALVIGGVAVLGIGVFITLERASGWYFDRYVVPAQQAEFAEREAADG